MGTWSWQRRWLAEEAAGSGVGDPDVQILDEDQGPAAGVDSRDVKVVVAPVEAQQAGLRAYKTMIAAQQSATSLASGAAVLTNGRPGADDPFHLTQDRRLRVMRQVESHHRPRQAPPAGSFHTQHILTRLIGASLIRNGEQTELLPDGTAMKRTATEKD